MSDFLDLVWGIDALFVDEHYELSVDEESAAILLVANPNNYDRFVKLSSFGKILATLGLELNKYGVQLSQIAILNSLKSLKIRRSELMLNLNELLKAKVIKESEFAFLSDFLSSIKIDENNVNSVQNFTFHKNLSSLNKIKDELSELSSPDLLQRLENASQNANNSRFFIAATGVVNAGKSSMLNALIGKDILGVSNIPETANLTLLGYGESENAQVEFWDIETLYEMGLDTEILGGKSKKTIKLENLCEFTAATSPFARHVKQINLSLNLDIFKNMVSIVDTPGLDDDVVWREELTKKYMQKSDFIIHLMNAAQSATKKDISFICETLLNSKSNGFALVLTHCDLLEKNELLSALDYAKTAVKTELKACGLDEKLASEIKYFTLSSKTKEGVAELKNYLYESFFGGDGKKASMIIDNYKKELGFVASILERDLDYNLRVIKNDATSVQDEAKNILAEIENLDMNSREFDDEIRNLLQNLKSNGNSVSSVKSVILRIKDRIIADVRYANSRGKKLDFARLGVICESGFNDLFIDLFRDFKQKLSKNIGILYDKIKLKFGASELEFALPNIKEYFDTATPIFGLGELKTRVNSLIKAKQKDENALSSELSAMLSEFVDGLNLDVVLDDLAYACTKDFLERLNFEINSIKSSLNSRKNTLLNDIAQKNASKESTDKSAKILRLNLEKITQIKARINAC